MSGVPLFIRVITAVVLLSTGLFQAANISLREQKLDAKYPKVVKPPKRDGDFPDVWERKY